ncbi:MAG: recombination mediator RecR [Chlamydiota bacterium]
MKYPTDLVSLIAYLKKLPGVGAKTAERFAFHLLNWQESQLSSLGTLIATIKEKIHYCPECGCLADDISCSFCKNAQRDQHLLCITSSPKDVFAIEETRIFHGLYHVLGGLLSPLHGCSPEELNIEKLKERALKREVKEIIIAIDSTLEGDATALYLKEQITTWGIRASRLAFGLPMGSTLDFVDGGTLTRALMGRQFL